MSLPRRPAGVKIGTGARRALPTPCERASRGSRSCGLDRCAQYVRFDKAILVGSGHMWRAPRAGALLS
jgi:hypothetical protein